MAIQTKIALETRFQLNNTIKNFKFSDDTDYASEGIAPADVLGAFVIKDPTGLTIYSTLLPAYDIDNNVDNTFSAVPLPLDANGDVITGNYTIVYTIRVAGAVQSGDYSSTFTYKFCYTAPIVVITVGVNLIDAKITSTDNTSYPVELLGSTLTHTLSPPRGVNAKLYPPKIVSTSVNYYTPISTKTWTTQISNVLELKYSDNLYIDDTITGDDEKEIKDNINICKLQCNLRALGDRYTDALRYNPINADKIAKESLTPAMYYFTMYWTNINCGNFDKAEEYYLKVLEFTGSQPDCSCSNSDTPALILSSSGGGAGGTFVVAVSGANNALSISSVVIGDTTTYTLLFNQTIFDKISALTETIVTSSDGSVTVTSSTPSGYSKVFDLSVPVQESKFVEVLMTLTAGGLPTYSIVSQKTYGSVFKSVLTDSGISQFIDIQNIADVPTWQGNYTKLIIQNFFSGADATYYPEIYSIEEITGKFLLSGSDNIAVTRKVEPIIYRKSGTNKFWVKFLTPTGIAVGNNMDAVGYLMLIFKINS